MHQVIKKRLSNEHHTIACIIATPPTSTSHTTQRTKENTTRLARRLTTSCSPARSRDRFPFNNFTPYLTPFSRCFSSFPHGTCSLSVSRPYLALDGVYHPFELHSQATRLVDALNRYTAQCVTGLSPSQVPLSREFTHHLSTPHKHVLILQFTPHGAIPNLSSSCFTRRY